MFEGVHQCIVSERPHRSTAPRVRQPVDAIHWPDGATHSAASKQCSRATTVGHTAASDTHRGSAGRGTERSQHCHAEGMLRRVGANCRIIF